MTLHRGNMDEIAMQGVVAIEDASERSSADARRVASEHERLRDLVILLLVRARGRPTTSGALAFGNPYHSGLLA